MKVIILITILLLALSCKKTQTTAENWTDVTSSKGEFKVQCPQLQSKADDISVNFREKDSAERLHCYVGELILTVNSYDWDVAQNQNENSERFLRSVEELTQNEVELFETPIFEETNKSRIATNGINAIQETSTKYKIIRQNFVINKRAFILTVEFSKNPVNHEEAKLSKNEMEIAQKFFNSFQIIKQ